MGISTVAVLPRRAGLRGVGLGRGRSSTSTSPARVALGGIGLDELAAEVLARHDVAYPDRPASSRAGTAALEVGGEYQWRREGEHHLFNPETVFRCSTPRAPGQYDVFKGVHARVDDQSER